MQIKVSGWYSKNNLIDMILVRQINPNYPVNNIEFREVKIIFVSSKKEKNESSDNQRKA
ncbi:hypothetical protein [Geminocystis sp. NIES-3709]|uniref:hypothetical protein n=1 Tax=Geminocystis sp. NIES-3709 TaxID=1617448 RepID=UPI00130DB43E|nr:hypothetical protein [Geminocystis sp. NIES-3709]